MTISAPLPKMKKITKQAVLEECKKAPRRKYFYNSTGIQKKPNGEHTFSVFVESAKIMFEDRFVRIRLEFSEEYKNYYSYLKESQVPKIRKWEEEQGRRVFLRDCLSLSIALDIYKEENQSGESSSRKYTPIGNLVKQGKQGRNESVIQQLAEAVAKEINDMPFYKDADLVCAVPSPAKFDLPRSVTSLVREEIDKQNITDIFAFLECEKTDKQDVTEGFVFAGQKSSVTTSSVDKKWGVWEKAELSFNSSKFDVKGKTIVLIDDKYQSGITTQYVAMKLQEAGADQIYGLSLVKTWSNTDNIRNVDNK